MTIRYEIDTKQRSGKWSCRCESSDLRRIMVEWKIRVEEMPTRAPENRRKLRCTKIEDGQRTVLARWAP